MVKTKKGLRKIVKIKPISPVIFSPVNDQSNHSLLHQDQLNIMQNFSLVSDSYVWKVTFTYDLK